MVDYSSRASIEQEALELRKRHDALAWEANVDELLKLEGLEQKQLSFWPTGPLAGLSKLIKAATKKVKAVLSLQESLVLLAPDLPDAKHPFAKGHELGHKALKWHRDILYVCDEHDLQPSTRDQLEWEANTFSAAVLVPKPLLEPLYEGYPTTMETVLQLRSWSGASIETCANAYVASHPRPCALMVLDEETDQDTGAVSLKLTRKLLSASGAPTKMGKLTRGQIFRPDHVLVTTSRVVGIANCKIRIGDSPKEYRVSTLNNSYRVLALVSDEDV